MSTTYGQKSQFTATDSSLRINIEDMVKKYPDYKFPALKRLTGKIFEDDVDSYKYTWDERDLRPVKALVVGAPNSGATAVVVDTAGVFNRNDIMINKRTGERMRVLAVSGGVNVTIERGFQGTTAAAMNDNDIVVRWTRSTPSGANAGNGITPGTEELYNFTQKYEDVVEMDDSQYKGFIHGDETKADGIARIQQELMENQHHDLFMGIRYRDAANKISTSGGVKYFTDTYAPENVVDFGGSGTWSSDTSVLGKLEDAVESIATKMGGKPTIYATYKALRKVRLVQDDTVRSTRSDKARGIGVVDTLMTGMGDLDIVQIIDRTSLMDDYIFMMVEENAGYKAFKGQGWFVEELAKQSVDQHKWQMFGNYTFKFATPKASLAYIKNLGL